MASASLTSEQVAAEDILHEVVDGEVVEIPPMGAYESFVCTILSGHLLGQPGRPTMETLFDFSAVIGRKRRPDLAFVSFERWPRDKPMPRGESWDVVPDLAVEVISPTNPANLVVEKVSEYFECGVRKVWVVYTSQKQIYVYDSATSVEILHAGDVLSDDQLFPDFQLALEDIFED